MEGGRNTEKRTGWLLDQRLWGRGLGVCIWLEEEMGVLVEAGGEAAGSN